ncbi:thiol-disulfide isomerase/thioredoxin [Lysobacter niastensis]|uniref:Thiol-disulfide isomerase/thioredoxin n=1 Tax=Lysobacter niastensis TaxID=380629 RepID=A0ABU1WA15_9GAMM|nr:thioredoxin family protein [Lysobacter niastensis]MDR7134317.1 thiol-disulfide isomerase/thioredoxin [Lysobacter niastensis]
MWKSIIAALCLCIAGCSPGANAGQASAPAPAPEFTGIERWFNSPPLTMAGLKGKVVLVEFWTYECINCIHVMPHVKQWHQRYHDQGLVVVGVHTPEYDEERIAANVKAAIGRFGIQYPVAQDNGYRTWDAYGNRFWPAMYLVDRDGKIVYRHYGEGDYDVTEARIRELLSSR